MVNVVIAIKRILYLLLKLAGMSQKRIQIDPQTVLNFWAPSQSNTKNQKNTTPKPVLLLLHGFCGDGILTWLFQVLYLSKTYAVHVPDLLFFGDSITAWPERSTAFPAECLAKGLKILGVEKCTCVGFSYGLFVGFNWLKCTRSWLMQWL
ncbi:serine protease [Lithospermum erythrorhizon]|uniref:Serine protease n=1 Tax=Lithospermum erythrorhizon TaxID=34254 RepID=A0AAV3PJK2_LITER